MVKIPVSRAEAEALDAQDPLHGIRDRFDLEDGIIYLDGNSLGPPTKAALARLQKTANIEWNRDLIKSWNDAGWIDLPRTCGRKIASLLGVDGDNVLVCDSVSVNIFKLASALLNQKPGAIAYEQGEFPTDGYILQGLAQQTGAPLSPLPADQPDALNENVSVLVKSAVNYKTAAVADIAAWERLASDHGVAIIWDLSHAAGIIDLNLSRDGARFAVGCGYKFLNGGPGAPGYIYVANEKIADLTQPLSGWMGHASPFDFADAYEPAQGIRRFACGTPPILSIAALDAALGAYEGVSVSAVEKKSRALGDIFISLSTEYGLKTVSPGPGEKRGGHVSLSHPNGYAIMQALIAQGIIGDFRPPDLMRFGFSPLYIRYTDIWDAANALKTILQNDTWREPAFAERKKVT